MFIEGRLRTSNWDDKETGQKRYRTEIIGEQMQFGPRRNAGGQQQASPAPQQSAPQPAGNAPAAAPAAPAKTPNYPEATINPDDIPF